ncbi:MAG: hypothetical protein LW818_05205, partial [Ignavibacteriae bacterium]|nr:hypothetical protein [Ignavibacteriota bacterium]
MSYPTPDSDNNSFNENSESQKPMYSYDGNNSSTGDDASGLGNQERERKPRTPYRSSGRPSDEERPSGESGSSQYVSRSEYQDRPDYRRHSYGDN